MLVKLGGQRRCKMRGKATMLSAHQEQREQQQAGLSDMGKVPRGPVTLLLLPPPHLHGDRGTRQQHSNTRDAALTASPVRLWVALHTQSSL